MQIGILGAGSWAISLAVLLAHKNHAIKMWEYNINDMHAILQSREHKTKLPGIIIPSSIQLTNNIEELFVDCNYIIVAVPSQTVRQTLQKIKKSVQLPQLSQIEAWIIASKGIECTTLKLMSDVLEDEISCITNNNIVILSGPSHAEEVARNIPTTVVAASQNNTLAINIQNEFSTETFRIYTNNDVIGTELCASIKNVIALATGISDGLGFGDNTKGALITRGMVEMVRLGKKIGAQEITFSGLAGFGDLVTTCISRHSRNRKMGELIASGYSLQEALNHMTMVAEGVETTKSVYQLAKINKIEMPITTAVYRTLFENMSPLEAVRLLMQRQFKPEDLI